MTKGKRNIGERAEIYFDSIDLQILEKLTTAKNVNNSPEGYGILEIADALKIKHNSLKPHIDKLRKLDLIFPYHDKEGKLRLWTDIARMEHIYHNDFSMGGNRSLEEEKEERENIEKGKTLLEYLKKVHDLIYQESMDKSVDIDFRKTRDIKGINDFKVAKTTENRHKKAGNSKQNKGSPSENKQRKS